jgi:hypothetical protein
LPSKQQQTSFGLEFWGLTSSSHSSKGFSSISIKMKYFEVENVSEQISEYSSSVDLDLWTM